MSIIILLFYCYSAAFEFSVLQRRKTQDRLCSCAVRRGRGQL